MATLHLPLPNHAHLSFKSPSFPDSVEDSENSNSISQVDPDISTSHPISRPEPRSTLSPAIATTSPQSVKNVEHVLYHPLNPRRPATFSRITGKIQQDPLTTPSDEEFKIDSQAAVRAEIHEAISSPITRPRSMSVPTLTIKSKQFIVHKVTQADTIHGVALRYGIEVERLRRINKLWPTDPIQIRENIYLPSDLCSISQKEIETIGVKLLMGEEIEQKNCLEQRAIFFSPLASETSTQRPVPRPRLSSSASSRTFNSATDYWLSTSAFPWSTIAKVMGSVSEKLQRNKTWTGDKRCHGVLRRPSLPDHFTRVDSELQGESTKQLPIDIPLKAIGERFI
ncbi:hypothetical protein K493DRAFT_310111 [Basidiobolus meristosporus CBS 931.73]|uniref:LysM domain-containing protein n=1 Tax=Basidiobolus meristosporus CBS 931.73 TaxID=1314790 RepID=A0A1Y1ZBT0_9FUNG|nr:hypothetical protein K493DRAFT_310111 [Basidiobolus meristosporus CBS 931.73]|eukprot:ORY07728.1 hypothetical protein K493DRAFT_310111 [Basidiobolus meristosporus CBS 931.73]